MNNINKGFFAAKILTLGLMLFFGIMLGYMLIDTMVGNLQDIGKLVFNIVAFGLSVVMTAIIDYFEEYYNNVRIEAKPSQSEIKQRALAKQEEIVSRYHKQKEAAGERSEVSVAELVDDDELLDEFAGDEVYDHLDGIFDYVTNKEPIDADYKITKEASVDLTKLPVYRLKEMCKDFGIQGYSKKRKHELVDLLNEAIKK